MVPKMVIKMVIFVNKEGLGSSIVVVVVVVVVVLYKNGYITLVSTNKATC